ncbi:MAG TPA: Asp-tRNA(Asn)/Glu-tRNA(Gln) amidotransferase subunit GatA [Clostridiaceae bacterium]|jgi:aspartyl-tRNA(Asn)/glutamyl-tRNA(Gln) amidotransferase subunit A|nr:Asp-tRNA(Asn)/Glu-tRNA(Gln) amidotransferase subunit GatA [Clostridiaceae bacterium]
MPNRLSISECIKLLDNREIKVTELVNAYLREIENRDEEINAFITVTKDEALEKAEELDRKGKRISPLSGIPGGIKDNICTKNINTTCASKMLKDFVPKYSATVYERLLDNDFVMLGKLNMDEFAIGGGGEYSYFKPVKNPYNISHMAGGSSSGSAASVAAFECAFSLGTDTGGSILKPSSYCGVVGMKPTFGTVSRYGVVGFAPSLEQTGPITRTVLDNAIVLSKIAGHDEKDPCSIKRDLDFLQDIDKGLKGLKIAVPKELMDMDVIQRDVRKCYEKSFEIFKELGCQVDVVSMPSLQYSLSAYYAISSSESASTLARYDGIRYGHRTKEYSNIEELYEKTRGEGFGIDVKKRILFGTFLLVEKEKNYLDKARKARTILMNEYERLFKEYSIVLTPASPITAPAFGEKQSNALEKYYEDIFTTPINLCGIPALSMPVCKDSNGLPVGIILSARHYDEKTLYRFGHAFEAARGILK